MTTVYYEKCSGIIPQLCAYYQPGDMAHQCVVYMITYVY